jgi:HSP20 family molecular chaperone IbpA
VLTLPAEAREGEIEAVYKNGVLEVRIPLNELRSDEGTRVPVTLA